jgi:hypothetical protein
MPELRNPRHEKMAQIAAEGTPFEKAAEQAGYSRTRACVISHRPDFERRLAEIKHQKALAIREGVTANAADLDAKASDLYDRFTKAVPVRGPQGVEKLLCACGNEHPVNVWRFDGKGAVSALDLRAKLAGLYVKNVNVRHGKIGEIEGTLDQIWERLAQMAEPLGREFKEWLIRRWGYEVVPANLRVIEGSAEDVTEATNAAS